jgi:hypothetical protein
MSEHHYRAAMQEMLVGGLRTPFGALVTRPWFDAVALRAIAGWFFPLSRLWGAARAARGSVDRFFEAAQVAPTPVLRRLAAPRLATFEIARAAAADAERAWEAAFFGGGRFAPETLAEVERQRLDARHEYNSLRGGFLPIRLAARVPPVRWEVPAPATVAALYDDLIADPPRAFVPPTTMPEVIQSRPTPIPGGRSYWLRYESPSARIGDRVVARVYEPADAEGIPTLIFGHGVCVDFDHWRGIIDEIEPIVGMGVRVVRPEAPWHGRRVPPDSYSGERFVATAPLGALDLFTAAAREWAVLIDRFRTSGTAPVAIGGTSLGAITAQIIADRSRRWPPHLRPDALLLITHCGQFENAVAEGALARAWGVDEATGAAGWTPELMGRYLALLDNRGTPSMAPERIVTVLGDRDDVTPYEGARRLIEDWGVPAENRFISRRGHFSVPMAMIRDRRPLERFHEILTGLMTAARAGARAGTVKA